METRLFISYRSECALLPDLLHRRVRLNLQQEVNLMKQTYLRGDMYYADLGDGIGSEQKGYRPVLIIQNNMGNKYSPTVIVAAITSKVGVKAKLPAHYYVKAVHGLQMPSVVLLEQLRTIDKNRLDTYIGRLPNRHIQNINHALAISVGLLTPMLKKLTICLCRSCADNFRNTGAFSLNRADPLHTEKNLCAYCNRRQGLDYVLAIKTPKSKGGNANV